MTNQDAKMFTLTAGNRLVVIRETNDDLHLQSPMPGLVSGVIEAA